MNKLKIVSIAAAACAAGLIARQAEARSLFPIGIASAGASQPCFAVNNGAVTNSCASFLSYDIPLHIDSTGTKTVQVFGRRVGPEGAYITCVAAAFSPTGSVTISPYGVINSTSFTSITLSVPVTAAKSSVIVECVMPPRSGAVLVGIDHNT